MLCTMSGSLKIGQSIIIFISLLQVFSAMANGDKRYGCWLTFFASLEGILYVVQLVSQSDASFFSFFYLSLITHMIMEFFPGLVAKPTELNFQQSMRVFRETSYIVFSCMILIVSNRTRYIHKHYSLAAIFGRVQLYEL